MSLYYQDPTCVVHQGDAREVLAQKRVEAVSLPLVEV